MADPLPKTNREPQYLEFFGMPSAPFARLSSTKSLYLTEQYSFLLAHLANATEKADSLILVCGQNGSGKTSLLNRFISSISENICFASINEFCDTETDFFINVLRQFGFGEISGSLEELRYITHEFLIQQGKAGDPVLLVIDNAHLLSPSVFEQLRWIVSVKYQDLAVTNIILAGNPELARIMESPAMSQISARNHVRFNIRAYTEEETASYIWHRLDLVGGRQTVQFAADVHPLIYRFTGGTPRLINILCDAALQQALEAKSKTITGEMLRRAAERHQLVPHAVPLQSKSRRKTDPGFEAPDESNVTELVQSRKQPAPPEQKEPPSASPASGPGDPDSNTAVRKSPGKSATPPQPDPKLLEKLVAVTEQAKRFKADALETSAALDEQSAVIIELEDKLDDKTQALDGLTSDLESSSNETKALRTKIDNLTRRLARQDKATAKLVSDLADRKHAIDRLESELGEASERLITLDGLEEACRTSQQQLLDRQTETTALRSELSILRRNEADLGEQLAIATARLAELDALRKAISDLEDEAGGRSNELANFRRQLSEQEKKAEKLETQLRGSEAGRKHLEEQAERIPQLENDLVNRDDRIEDIQSALIERDEELRQLKGQLDEQASKSAQLETELSGVTKIAADLEQQATENQGLSEMIAARDHELAALQEDSQTALTKRDEELRQLNEQLNEQATKSAQLETELSGVTKIAVDLEQQATENQGLSEMIAARDHELAALQEDSQTKLTQRDEDLRQLKGQLNEQATKSRQLEAELSRAAKIAVDLEQQVIENQQLSEVIATKDEELAALQAALNDNSDFGQLHKAELARIGKLESQLQETTQLADDLRNDLQARDESITGLQAEIAGSREENGWLKSEIQRLREVDEKFAAQVEGNKELTSDLADRDRQLAQLAEAQTELEKTLEEARGEVTSLEDAAQHLEMARSEISDLQEQLALGNQNIESLNSELAKQTEEIGELRSDAERLRDTEGSLADQMKLADELQSQLDASKKEQLELASTLKEQATLLDVTNKEKEELVAALDEHAALLEAGTKEKDELASALSEQATLLEASMKEKEELAATLGEQATLLEAGTKEKDELASALDEHAAQLEASMKEKEELAATLSEESSRLDSNKKDREALSAKLTEHMTLLDAANQKIARMMKAEAELASATEKLSDLENDLHDNRGSVDALQSELEEKSELVATLQAEIDRLSTSEEKLSRQNDSMADKDQLVKELRNEIAALSDELREREGLRERVVDNSEEVAEFEQKIAMKSEEFSALADKYASLESALNEAQKNLAEQALELSASHTVSIQASDFEERLAEQLEINAELSGELELQATRARVLEARIQALGAAEKIAQEAAREPEPPRPEIDAIDVSDGSVVLSIVYDGRVEQEIVHKIEGLRCIIGRSEDSDIRLNVDTVSRHHAILSCQDDSLYIEDLNSTNGIELNFRRITLGKLQFGDVVTVGDYELKFLRSE